MWSKKGEWSVGSYIEMVGKEKPRTLEGFQIKGRP